MEVVYKYTSSIEYVEGLEFAYLETYSFQRGVAYENNLQLINPEYDNLRNKDDKHHNLTNIEQLRFSELNELLGRTQYLITSNGLFHPSSEKINTFSPTDPQVARLRNILCTEIKEIPRWLCAPVYRDAVVFYNNSGKIISTLNVCLSCQYMEIAPFNHINGDYRTYDLLKRYFIDIGHNVENPEKFVYEDILKMKAKYESSETKKQPASRMQKNKH